MRNFPAGPLGLASGVLVAAVVLSRALAPAAEAPKPAPTTNVATSSRAPDASERAAMLEILRADETPERAAWLSYTAGNAESQALADTLGAIFREAGWKVESSALSGMVLKPGVSVLLADEQPPAWAESALRAMQASGVEVKSASGYKPYYDEKKAENPKWPGVPLAKDAVYVIVVGPEPKG